MEKSFASVSGLLLPCLNLFWIELLWAWFSKELQRGLLFACFLDRFSARRTVTDMDLLSLPEMGTCQRYPKCQFYSSANCSGKKAVYCSCCQAFLTFADGARVHTGLRLLKRAIRHATDSVAPDVLGATLEILEYLGKLCTGLFHRV